MNIYVDFDDCLCETARYFAGLAKEEYGRNIPYEEMHFFNMKKTFDFTEEEYDLYMKIINLKSQLDEMDEKKVAKEEKQPIIEEKNKVKAQLENLILKHGDTPRTVRLKSILYYPKDADYPFPLIDTSNC